eukprot:COSAG01_NODE_193_length_22433_cov_91.669114_18_plen_217_part_00
MCSAHTPYAPAGPRNGRHPHRSRRHARAPHELLVSVIDCSQLCGYRHVTTHVINTDAGAAHVNHRDGDGGVVVMILCVALILVTMRCRTSVGLQPELHPVTRTAKLGLHRSTEHHQPPPRCPSTATQRNNIVLILYCIGEQSKAAGREAEGGGAGSGMYPTHRTSVPGDRSSRPWSICGPELSAVGCHRHRRPTRDAHPVQRTPASALVRVCACGA